MRIAIFSDTFPPQVNGVAKAVALMEKTLRAHGHNVRVFCSREATSIPFWGYPGERIVLPVGTAYRKAKEFNPEIIHSHTPFGIGWEAIRLARSLNIPVVGTHHTFFDHYLDHVHLGFDWIKKLSWKYVAWYYNKCNIVTGSSRVLLDAMKKGGLRKEQIFLPYALDLGSFLPVTKNQKDELKKKFGIKGLSAVYMGRLSYEKSIGVVLGAYKEILAKHPNTTLLIVGDGPQRKELEEMVTSLSIKNNVIFTGMLSGNDLVESIQANEFFVTASKSENMPLSIMEAMAVGLPVIGVDSLGVPLLVRNNQNGFIVPTDNIQAFSEKMSLLFTDTNLRERYSKSSRDIARLYDKDENIKVLEEIYSSLLN